MLAFQLSLVVHLVGVGMLFTTIFAGLILHAQYRRAADWKTKLLYLKTLRLIGLLSPAGVAVMILSGIGNMTLGPHHYTLFSDGWLSAKLMLVVLLIIVGVLQAIQGSRRTRIIARLGEGSELDVPEHRLRALDNQMILFYVIEAVFILAIIILSITRPQG